jgi:hypothetical protein
MTEEEIDAAYEAYVDAEYQKYLASQTEEEPSEESTFVDDAGDAAIGTVKDTASGLGDLGKFLGRSTMRGSQMAPGPTALPMGMAMEGLDAVRGVDFSNMDPAELAKGLTKGVGAGMGGAAGGLKGAALGSAFGPIGTVGGAALGAMGGGALGQMGGDLVGQTGENLGDVISGADPRGFTNPITGRNVGEGMVAGAFEGITSLSTMSKYLKSLDSATTSAKGLDMAVKGIKPTSKKLMTKEGVNAHEALDYFYNHPDVISSGAPRSMDATGEWLKQRIGGKIGKREFKGTLKPQLEHAIRNLDATPGSETKLFGKTAPDGSTIEDGLFYYDDLTQSYALKENLIEDFDETTSKNLRETLHTLVQDEKDRLLRDHPKHGNLLQKHEDLLSEIERIESSLAPAAEKSTGVLDASGNEIMKQTSSLTPRQRTRALERLDELHQELAPISEEVANPTVPFSRQVDLRRRMESAADSTFDQQKRKFTPEGALKRDVADTVREKLDDTATGLGKAGSDYIDLNKEFHYLKAFEEDFDKAYSSEFNKMPKRKLKVGPLETQGSFLIPTSPYIYPTVGFSQPGRADLITKGGQAIPQVSPSDAFRQGVKSGAYKGTAASMAAQQYNEPFQERRRIPRNLEGVMSHKEDFLSRVASATGDQNTTMQLSEILDYGSDKEKMDFIGGIMKAFPSISSSFEPPKTGALSEFEGKVRDKEDLASMATMIENGSGSLGEKAEAYNRLWKSGEYKGDPINSSTLPGEFSPK